MCELISDFCDRGEMWEPSEEFITEHHEVAYLVAHRDALIERAGVRLRHLRISQLRRTRDAIASKVDGWADILRDIPEGSRKSWRRRWLDRMERLDAACLAEIERLRGMG